MERKLKLIDKNIENEFQEAVKRWRPIFGYDNDMRIIGYLKRLSLKSISIDDINDLRTRVIRLINIDKDTKN